MSHPFRPSHSSSAINPRIVFTDSSANPMPVPARKLLERAISLVEDGRPGQDSAIRNADDILDPLNATELAVLRQAEFEARRNGQPLFRCAVCQGPVHSRVRGVLETEMTGGLRAFFVHDPRSNARFCPVGNLSVGASPAMIDAIRFRGKQEGRRHAGLKFDLMDSLERDPMFSDVGVERTVRDADGAWRRPDVMAQTARGPIGFDVQLVAPLLDSILGRQRFYANAGVGHLWIVDAANPGCLNLQGFLDVVLPQGGIILGFDERAAALTAESGELTMHLMSVSEDPDRHRFNVSSELIGRNSILDLAGLRSPTALPVAGDLRAAALFTALRQGDRKGLDTSFGALAAGCGILDVTEAEEDGVFEVIATLATLVMGRKANASNFRDDAVNAIVNHFLRAEQTGMRPNFVHRAWAPVLGRAAFHPSVREWIDKRGTRTRHLLDAAVFESAGDPDLSNQLIRDWLRLLDRLFPGLRLAQLRGQTASPPPE